MVNLEVSLVKELCPVCGKEIDGPIIMNSTLTEEEANKIKELQGKVIGFADHCCEDCSKYKDDVVWLIEIDPTIDENNKFFRTGNIYGIRKEAEFIENSKEYINELKDGTRIMFADIEACKQLGLCSK